jgi:putative autoinducer-2 (AI-2) aldolase
VSSGNSILNEDLSNEELCVSIEDAIRLMLQQLPFRFISAVLMKHQTIVEFSKLVNDAHRYGLPVLAVTACGQGYESRSSVFVSCITHCCGIRALI